MVPNKTVDGTTTWIPASATCPSTTVVSDCNLDSLDFTQVIPCLVTSLTECGWGHDRVHMLVGFWGALMLHCFWNLVDPLDQRALLLYQEEQRHAWRQAIPLPGGAWDISILDDAELTHMLDRIYREDRRHKDNEFDYQVSIIFPTSLFTSLICSSTFLYTFFILDTIVSPYVFVFTLCVSCLHSPCISCDCIGYLRVCICVWPLCICVR